MKAVPIALTARRRTFNATTTITRLTEKRRSSGAGVSNVRLLRHIVAALASVAMNERSSF